MKCIELKKCLSCKYARNILRCYLELRRHSLDNLSDETKKSLAELLEFLQLGDVPDSKSAQQVLEIFDNPQKFNLYERTEYEVCIQMLTTIIHEMRCFFRKDYYVFAYGPLTATVFVMMLDSMENESCSLQKRSLLKKYVRKFSHLDEKIDDKRVGEPTRKLKFKTIAESPAITKKEYRQVALNYIKVFDNFIGEHPQKWAVKKRYDCMMNEIISLNNKNQALAERYQRFVDRRNSLNKYAQNLVDRFVKGLPTNFGHNLKKIMEIKGMSESTLMHLIKPLASEVNVSDIQWLKERKDIYEDPAFIRLLCRILLVDRNALYTGTGKSYGNWMPYLSNKNMAREGLERLNRECSTEEKSSAKIKTAFRNVLAQLLSKDMEVEQLISSQSKNFEFVEEEISVFIYEDEDNDERYIDPVEHFKYILDTTPINILLDTLETMEKDCLIN